MAQIDKGKEPTSRRSIRDNVLDVAFVGCVILFGYTATTHQGTSPPSDVPRTALGASDSLSGGPVSLAGATLQGSPSAKVAVIEYLDFECPYCGKFARETLPALDAGYIRTGKVLLAVRHYPLPNHQLAVKAAEAAECAGEQGKFWEMHLRLFQEPRNLHDRVLLSHAQPLADSSRFEACLKAGWRRRSGLTAQARAIDPGPPRF
jgi:hypothetical protein